MVSLYSYTLLYSMFLTRHIFITSYYVKLVPLSARYSHVPSSSYFFWGFFFLILPCEDFRAVRALPSSAIRCLQICRSRFRLVLSSCLFMLQCWCWFDVVVGCDVTSRRSRQKGNKMERRHKKTEAAHRRIYINKGLSETNNTEE